MKSSKADSNEEINIKSEDGEIDNSYQNTELVNSAVDEPAKKIEYTNGCLIHF